MGRLLVPHDATSSGLTVWIGAVSDAPAGLQLEVGGRAPVAVADDAWSVWQVHGRPVFWSQRVRVEDLEAGRRFPLRLLENGVAVATGTAVTLPQALPTLDEGPFICLVGSCFAHYNDAAGAAGAAFAGLPAGARPHVKFLCGDQVYLDAPFPRYLHKVFGEADLQAELLTTYLSTWSQGGDGRGFAELLRDGATYFGSDDHELWNNAPLPTPVVRATWWPLGDRGRAWLRIAGRLYDDFQTPARSAEFRVGRLSFRVLDTRFNRSMDRARFAEQAEMDATERWVDGLDGPGVLVVGQPIFVQRTGVRGYLTDWGLADYGHYGDLVRALARSEHDVVVLTGDVHFGRICGCRLPSGAMLTEVIASPFALVDSRVGGKWQPPPRQFPAFPVAGVPPAEVWFEKEHDLAKDQFATLEFNADGSRVRVAVRAWPVPPPGQAPTSRLVYQAQLQ